MLKAGDAAPDFVLKDAEGKDLRLSTFSGRPIVLYFYPKDFTVGCTLQAKSFRDHHQEISARNAVVVGVSLDDVDSHCRFRDKHGLPFHLLADPDGRVHDLYEAWKTSLLGRSSLAVRRCTFIIDPAGIIRKVYRSASRLGHGKQVIRDLERLDAQQAWGKANGSAKPEGPGKAEKPEKLVRR